MPKKSLKERTLEKLMSNTDPTIQLKAALAQDRIDARRDRGRKLVVGPTQQDKDFQAVLEMEN